MGTSKRILHVGMIGSPTSTLARIQRSLGYDSYTFDYLDRPGWPGFPTDLNANVQQMPNRPLMGAKLLGFVLKERLYSRYDIYHCHFGRSLLPFNFDVPLLKASGKQIIAHYRGSDIRGRRQNVLMKKLADVKFVSTPDLLAYVPEAVWIPNPIEVSSYQAHLEKAAVAESGALHIVHAPSARQLKGTNYISEAVEELRRQGCNIEFTLIENAAHSHVLRALSSADIVVDQIALQAGWYGVFACEAMAQKKPVCVYIRDDLEQKYLPSRPVMNINPSNITERLKLLIDDPELRSDLAEKGYTYVKQIHDAAKVTRRVMEFYKL